jgi:hypothetical protein
MGLFEKDRLIKLLEQLTKMLLAIRAALAAGNAPEALDAIRDARAALAGPLGGSLERVDASTVVALIGEEKARVYVELARLEAEARTASGDDAGARKATARADDVERATPSR